MQGASAWPLRQRTLSLPFLVAWAVLIVYASLFPFEGWRWPAGLPWQTWLALPWPPWRDRLDEVINLLGYVPLGVFAAVVGLRRGYSVRVSAGAAVGVALAMSYAVELLQTMLPLRVPSLKDVGFNSLGAALGASLVAALHGSDVTQRIRAAHGQWFGRRNAVGLTLLMLWPVALLSPHPVPLGLGHGGSRGVPWIQDLLGDTVLASWWSNATWVGWPSAGHGLLGGLESSIVALGLLGPCLMAYATTIDTRLRPWLVAGAALLALGFTSLAASASVGPEHALAWLTGDLWRGLMAALALALAGLTLSRPASAWLAALAVVGQVVLVTLAPDDPYFAETVSSWEQGDLMRFHGLAHWVGTLWPYAAVAWLLAKAWRVELSRMAE
jgi:VanZ family protein/type IV secretory pathway VirB2 component (pilin)